MIGGTISIVVRCATAECHRRSGVGSIAAGVTADSSTGGSEIIDCYRACLVNSKVFSYFVIPSTSMTAFEKKAITAGFTPNQAAFLDAELAKYPHEHEMEDIVGLEEALETDEEDDDSDDDQG